MKKFLLLCILFFLSFSFLSTSILAENSAQQVIIVFEEEVDQNLLEEYEIDVDLDLSSIEAVSAEISPDLMEELEDHPVIKAVEVDQIVQLHTKKIEWPLKKIEAPRAWESSYTGKGVKVAVLDTGISSHEDLLIAGGISFIPGIASFSDDNGHGTHVAGIISGLHNSIGIAGVAPDTELYAVKILDQDGIGYLSETLNGIAWSIEHEMDIINLSLGVPLHSPLLKAAVDNAYKDGILVVAAVGNNGNSSGTDNAVEYPARYDTVIAVGATDATNNRPAFSATGSTLEIVAPGSQIRSTFLNNRYISQSGTSMATPFVAGVLALMIEENPDASHKKIREAMQLNALDLGVQGKDPFYGHGLVQAPLPIDSSEVKEPVVMSVRDWVTHANSITGVSARLDAYMEAYEIYPDHTEIIEGIHKSSKRLFDWSKKQHEQGKFETAINRYERILALPILSDHLERPVKKHLEAAKSNQLAPTASSLNEAAANKKQVSAAFRSYIQAYEWYPENKSILNGLQNATDNLYSWAKTQHDIEKYGTASQRYEMILSSPALSSALRKNVEVSLRDAKNKKRSANVIFTQAEKSTSSSVKLRLYSEGHRFYPKDNRFTKGIESSSLSLLNWARSQHNKGSYTTAANRYQLILDAPKVPASIQSAVKKHLASAKKKEKIPSASSLLKTANSKTTVSSKFNAFVSGYSWYPMDTRFENGIHSSSQNLYSWAKKQHDLKKFDTAIRRYEMILKAPVIKSSLKKNTEAQLALARNKK